MKRNIYAMDKIKRKSLYAEIQLFSLNLAITPNNPPFSCALATLPLNKTMLYQEIKWGQSGNMSQVTWWWIFTGTRWKEGAVSDLLYWPAVSGQNLRFQEHQNYQGPREIALHHYGIDPDRFSSSVARIIEVFVFVHEVFRLGRHWSRNECLWCKLSLSLSRVSLPSVLRSHAFGSWLSRIELLSTDPHRMDVFVSDNILKLL